MAQAREQWGSSVGFVLAAVGSAVGLGNMWRFSYLTAEHGGAAFVVLYLLLVLLIGLPIMLAEFAVGRSTRRSPIEALGQLGGKLWRPLGFFFVATGFLILAYYSVISGWVVRYTWSGLTTGFGADASARFGDVSQGWDAVAVHVLFMLVTIGVVAAGVRRGLERAALYLMPLLFLLIAGLAAYAATLTGATEGYRAYLVPDVAALFSMDVLAAAASQAFFSLSLGMGALLTYSSYLSSENHLPKESVTIAGADFAVAFVAGLMVFPIIFALGLSEAVGESTVGTLFISLPGAFGEMGTAGRVVGIAFFVTLFVAALTSAISLLEVVVASAMDTLGWRRGKAALVGGAAIALIGIPTALDINVLGLYDTITGQVFLVLGALLMSVFVGWRMADPEVEVRKGAPRVAWLPLWRQWLRYVIPIVLLLILIRSVPAAIGSVRGLLFAP